MAKVYRIKTDLVNLIFMLLLAANIVINVKSAGIILVTAQLILPAVIAFNFVHQLSKAIFISLSWWLYFPLL